MTQFQISKTDLATTRIVTTDLKAIPLAPGEILVRIEKFGFSANNVTYAVAGETLSYWQFFPASGADAGDDASTWGVLPVWGFAKVIAANDSPIAVGERLFGYFPPATHLVMSPVDTTPMHFFDGAPHRAELPKGYNMYRRVDGEPEYNSAGDDMRMLLYPLYITSFCLWDLMKDENWYGAEQVIIISASSKTAIGLAYALEADEDAPSIVGMTSPRNMDFVDQLGIYDQCVGYDGFEAVLADKPSMIVDMAGNAQVLGQLHQQLGDNMVKTLNVGLTHWESNRRDDKIIRDRSEFFFAPSRIQTRMKDWGAKEFGTRSTSFVMETAAKSSQWLQLKQIDDLRGLEQVYLDAVKGNIDPAEGLLIKL